LVPEAAYIQKVGREASPGEGDRDRRRQIPKTREGRVVSMLDIAVAMAFAGMVLLPALVAMGSSSAQDETNVEL